MTVPHRECARCQPAKIVSASSLFSIHFSLFSIHFSLFTIHLKRKHCPYKPGSVPVMPLVPAIYLLRTSPCVSSVLPSIAFLTETRADNPYMAMVYMNLRPPAGTARRSPADWWSLTPPSHPYLASEAVIFFFPNQLSPAASTFRSGASCAARTFLSPLLSETPAASQGSAFWTAKVVKDYRKLYLLTFFL